MYLADDVDIAPTAIGTVDVLNVNPVFCTNLTGCVGDAIHHIRSVEGVVIPVNFKAKLIASKFFESMLKGKAFVHGYEFSVIGSCYPPFVFVVGTLACIKTRWVIIVNHANEKARFRHLYEVLNVLDALGLNLH
jgi:hypothetical protein